MAACTRVGKIKVLTRIASDEGCVFATVNELFRQCGAAAPHPIEPDRDACQAGDPAAPCA